MSVLPSPKAASQIAASYRRLPLIALIEFIAYDADTVALREFHDHRTIFQHKVGSRLRLAEYLEQLRGTPAAWRWCGKDANVLDQSYDLTNDKFSHFPSTVIGQTAGLKGAGPDCRCYFSAFLRHIAPRLEGVQDSVEAELTAAQGLQNFVYRHFLLSCLECARRLRQVARRFFWKLKRGTLCVWMPSDMSGSACRSWLEMNVDAPDPDRPNERARVQDLIDQRLGRRRIVRLSESMAESHSDSRREDIPWSVQYELSTQGLVEAVAQEKAQRIDAQRPAIRHMGPERLARMIRRIFQDLANGAYQDNRLAREFDLSKATFSRFAGSRWRRGTGGSVGQGIPDLWRNVAAVLAGHPAFVEAVSALTAGKMEGRGWFRKPMRMSGHAGASDTSDLDKTIRVDWDDLIID